jgi:RNA polymerase sigma-70 factor (ECF subfamily)
MQQEPFVSGHFPVGNPYQDSEDSDTSDTYPCLIKGLVYVSGQLNLVPKLPKIRNESDPRLYNMREVASDTSKGNWMKQDAEVIRCVIDGEVDAFRLLVERYQQPVLCFVRNMISERHYSEDLAQDVFLTAFEKLHSFDAGRSQFLTWLLVIARNKCINALKKETPIVGDDLAHPAVARTPYDELAGKELLRRLDEALAALPAAQKTVFVLAELMEMSHDQIAQIEGVRAGTIRSRLCRAKQQLRVHLRDYVGRQT